MMVSELGWADCLGSCPWHIGSTASHVTNSGHVMHTSHVTSLKELTDVIILTNNLEMFSLCVIASVRGLMGVSGLEVDGCVHRCADLQRMLLSGELKMSGIISFLCRCHFLL